MFFSVIGFSLWLDCEATMPSSDLDDCEVCMQVAVREAKNTLSKLGQKAHAGERIVVTRNGEPWFDLVPHRRKGRRTSPLPHVKPTISVEEAIAPVASEDIPGWQ